MKLSTVFYWSFVVLGLTTIYFKEHFIAVISLGMAQAIDNFSQPKPWKERSLLAKIWTTILFTLVFCLIGLEVAILYK